MGEQHLIRNANDDAVEPGVYVLNFTGVNLSQSSELIVVKLGLLY